MLTRGAVAAERAPGGFAGVYKVLAAFEDAGRTRRGYYVEGLGAAQFSTPGAVDRLRAGSDIDPRAVPTTVTLAATDPANPYGAALPWPTHQDATLNHRPGRKAGALVVLVDGALVLYVERGGRTLLAFSDDETVLGAAAAQLAASARHPALGGLSVERVNGSPLLGSGESTVRAALDAAGFVTTPQGLRIR